MKNKKIIFLILVTLLFSGCSVKYNLYINNDLSVNEKIIASEDSDIIKKNTYMAPKVAANSIFDSYKIKGNKYSFSTVEGEETTTSTASTSFESLDEYEEYFKSDIVKSVKVTKNKSYVTLEFEQDVPLKANSSRSLIYDDIEVNLDIPFVVTEENADSANGNTYTWNITKNGELKDIKITFDTNRTKKSRKLDLGFFKINVNYSVFLLLGFVAVISIIVLIVYINSRRNNKF